MNLDMGREFPHRPIPIFAGKEDLPHPILHFTDLLMLRVRQNDLTQSDFGSIGEIPVANRLASKIQGGLELGFGRARGQGCRP